MRLGKNIVPFTAEEKFWCKRSKLNNLRFKIEDLINFARFSRPISIFLSIFVRMKMDICQESL